MQIKRYFNVFLFSCLIILGGFLLFYFIVPKQNKSVNTKVIQEFNNKQINSLEDTMLLSRNEDNGFHDYIRGLNFEGDLYTTYYVMQIKRELGMEIDQGEFLNLADWVGNNETVLFYNRQAFDNVSNIYYATNIFSNNISEVLDTSKIVKYIKSLMLEDGSYTLSLKHKAMVNNEEDDLIILSTYQALKVLNTIDQELLSKVELDSWMKNNLESYVDSEKVSLDTIGNLILLYKIASIIDFNLIDYNDIFKQDMSSLQKEFEQRFAQKKLSSIDLHNYIEFHEVLHMRLDKSQSIYQYYKMLEHDNHMVSVLIDEKPDILSTYFSIYFLTRQNDMQDYKNLMNLFIKYKLDNGSYINISEIPSDILNTLAVINISSMLDFQHIDEEKSMEYLSNSIGNINTLDPFIKYLYIKTFINTGRKDDVKQKVIIDNIINQVTAHLQLEGMVDYYTIYHNLLTLDLFDIGIPDEYRASLINNLLKEKAYSEEFSLEKKSLISTYKLGIARLLGYFDKSEVIDENLNYLQDVLVQYKNINQSEITYYIYYVVSEIQYYDSEYLENKKDIIDEIILSSLNTDGTFRMGSSKEAIGSYFSTYLSLETLKATGSL